MNTSQPPLWPYWEFQVYTLRQSIIVEVEAMISVEEVQHYEYFILRDTSVSLSLIAGL